MGGDLADGCQSVMPVGIQLHHAGAFALDQRAKMVRHRTGEDLNRCHILADKPKIGCKHWVQTEPFAGKVLAFDPSGPARFYRGRIDQQLIALYVGGNQAQRTIQRSFGQALDRLPSFVTDEREPLQNTNCLLRCMTVAVFTRFVKDIQTARMLARLAPLTPL